jgi:PAS domain-containing protein
MDSSEYPVLEALKLPVLLLDADHRIAYANQAARDLFELQGLGMTCHETFRRQDHPCEQCSAWSLESGREWTVRITVQGRDTELTYRRLGSQVMGASVLVTASAAAPVGQADDEAVRRMKHRFNNYLAPMAGKAEIILFALRKRNYEKAEKAANDILKHAEDSAALDALFDLEPAQEESTRTTYFAT